MMSNGPEGNKANYLNVPWGGVRTTVLSSVAHAQSNGDLNKVDFYPWGSTEEVGDIFDIGTKGGYTTFAQDLPDDARAGTPYPIPADPRPTYKLKRCQLQSSDSRLRCEIFPTTRIFIHSYSYNNCFRL